MVIKDILSIATDELKEISDTPALDSRILLEKACNCDRLFLIKNRDKPLPSESIKVFNNFLKRRLSGEPVAYITGTKEFMGLNFKVDKNVLIPRPDTEILAEYAIANCRGKILDIGTGSGCIAISLAKYIDNSSVTAIDISQSALDIAADNAKENNVSIKFICMDVLKNELPGEFDAIVSNPPYIRTTDILTLEKNVQDFEPYGALSGGDNGLIFYNAITPKAYSALKPSGILAYEIGFDQADDVVNIMKPYFDNVIVLKDFGGNDRVVAGSKKALL